MSLFICFSVSYLYKFIFYVIFLHPSLIFYVIFLGMLMRLGRNGEYFSSSLLKLSHIPFYAMGVFPPRSHPRMFSQVTWILVNMKNNN